MHTNKWFRPKIWYTVPGNIQVENRSENAFSVYAYTKNAIFTVYPYTENSTFSVYEYTKCFFKNLNSQKIGPKHQVKLDTPLLCCY